MSETQKEIIKFLQGKDEGATAKEINDHFREKPNFSAETVATAITQLTYGPYFFYENEKYYLTQIGTELVFD